jgi:hypothetical protein
MGVELKLYAFQLAQSQPDMTVPLAPTVLPKQSLPNPPFNRPRVHDWATSDIFSALSNLDTELLDFPSWEVPPTPPQWVAPAKVTPVADWMQIPWPPKEHTQDIAVAKARSFMQITLPPNENTPIVKSNAIAMESNL